MRLMLGSLTLFSNWSDDTAKSLVPGFRKLENVLEKGQGLFTFFFIQSNDKEASVIMWKVIGALVRKRRRVT